MREFGSLIYSKQSNSSSSSKFVQSSETYSWISSDSGTGLDFHKESGVFFFDPLFYFIF